MVSPIEGNSSVAQVLQQQRQQVASQQDEQRIKEQQEANRQVQESRAAESSRNDADDRKGRSVNLSV
ncbi:MAG: hypothetical protein HRT55_17495 [Colwellia sp.]|uniref:hypothetical protein n=1 Tax=Colwellia sp. TaxID=56799 RepID=UPI0025BDC44B|nr:hypothetical protein [Colwellia sp.]NQZ28099.1 hypothetical protein [Colwellia sp.]